MLYCLGRFSGWFTAPRYYPSKLQRISSLLKPWWSLINLKSIYLNSIHLLNTKILIFHFFLWRQVDEWGKMISSLGSIFLTSSSDEGNKWMTEEKYFEQCVLKEFTNYFCSWVQIIFLIPSTRNLFCRERCRYIAMHCTIDKKD